MVEVLTIIDAGTNRGAEINLSRCFTAHAHAFEVPMTTETTGDEKPASIDEDNEILLKIENEYRTTDAAVPRTGGYNEHSKQR